MTGSSCLHWWRDGVGARFCYHCGMTDAETAEDLPRKPGRKVAVDPAAPIVREAEAVRLPEPPPAGSGAMERARIVAAARDQRNRLAALRRMDDVDQWDHFVRWLERA